MLKKDLILRNPLRILGKESGDILPPGGFGAVLARAGVGKTAILVQLAMDSLLKGRNVLHVSLQDPVKKTCLWYEEVFRNISTQYQIRNMDRLWETILPLRLIMAFKPEAFSVAKLEDRINELSEQDVFLPQVILIDGLAFDGDAAASLKNFKALARRHPFRVWFAVRTHRHETPESGGIPASFEAVEDLFEVALQLMPRPGEIHLKVLKQEEKNADDAEISLFLDPRTMLIIDKKD